MPDPVTLLVEDDEASNSARPCSRQPRLAAAGIDRQVITTLRGFGYRYDVGSVGPATAAVAARTPDARR